MKSQSTPLLKELNILIFEQFLKLKQISEVVIFVVIVVEVVVEVEVLLVVEVLVALE